MMTYPGGKESLMIRKIVSTQYQNVTDRHTDGKTYAMTVFAKVVIQVEVADVLTHEQGRRHG